MGLPQPGPTPGVSPELLQGPSTVLGGSGQAWGVPAPSLPGLSPGSPDGKRSWSLPGAEQGLGQGNNEAPARVPLGHHQALPPLPHPLAGIPTKPHPKPAGFAPNSPGVANSGWSCWPRSLWLALGQFQAGSAFGGSWGSPWHMAPVLWEPPRPQDRVSPTQGEAHPPCPTPGQVRPDLKQPPRSRGEPRDPSRSRERSLLCPGGASWHGSGVWCNKGRVWLLPQPSVIS